MIVRKIGVLGVLLLAKEKGVIENVKPLLDALEQKGFYIAREIYKRVLQISKEI